MADSTVLPPQPQLFQLGPIDVVEPWQQELVDSFHKLTKTIEGRSQIEIHDILHKQASESMQAHGELVNGLVYGILTDIRECSTYFRHLGLVSRDGYAHAVSRLQLVVCSHKFSRLRPDVRNQLFWILSALIHNSARGTDQLILLLTRQMRSGDVTQPNIKLCTQVLDLVQASYEWVLGHPALIATCAYAFGRLILDHSRNLDLRDQECTLVIRLLRERFAECAVVGRDLVRMLQDVAKIPQFADLWQDLLTRPYVLSRQFTGGIEQLMRVPTPRMFLANRLTFDMEHRLLFILEKLPHSGYARNLMWFVHRYLSTPESESLYADLIRYICGVFHPPNAVLASNIVPRYVLLGALVRFIRSPVVAANAKLALFYDWMFYDPQVDNIMNIEPGVLILVRSIDKYAYMTDMFIEFLSFVSEAYMPALSTTVQQSIGAVMRDAVEKGVVSSLMPVYEHPRIDKGTRGHMRNLFTSLVPAAKTPTASPEEDSENDQADDIGALDLNSPGTKPMVTEPAEPPAIAAAVEDSRPLDPIARMFEENSGDHHDMDVDNSNRVVVEDLFGNEAEEPESNQDDDEEEEPMLPEPSVKGGGTSEYTDLESALADKSLWLFGDSLQELVNNNNSSATLVKGIVDVFAQSEASIQAVTYVLAHVIDRHDLEDVETNTELQQMGETEVEHDLLYYLFVASAQFFKSQNSTHINRLVDLLILLTQHKEDVGFRWMLFCCEFSERYDYYVQYIKGYSSDPSLLSAGLARDVPMLQERFSSLFYQVLPKLYTAFGQSLAGSTKIVHSVLSLIDQPHVYRLSMLIAKDQLQLFGNRAPAIVASLIENDAFEQVCLWQLVAAEIGGNPSAIARVSKRLLLTLQLDPESHSEAANGLLMLLRITRPTLPLLQTLARYYENEEKARVDFCGNVLGSWARASDRLLLVEMLTAEKGTAVNKMLTGLKRFTASLDQLFQDVHASRAKQKVSTPEVNNSEVNGTAKRRAKSPEYKAVSSNKRVFKRRHVITSDDEEDKDHEEAKIEASSPPSVSPSPVLSSSSLSSNDDDSDF